MPNAETLAGAAPTKTFAVTGPLNALDLSDLLAAVRVLCNRRPEVLFTVVIDDPEGTMEQGEDTVRRFMPNGFIHRYPRRQ